MPFLSHLSVRKLPPASPDKLRLWVVMVVRRVRRAKRQLSSKKRSNPLKKKSAIRFTLQRRTAKKSSN